MNSEALQEAIAQYFKSGKSITVCKPATAQGVRFWNPGNDVLKMERIEKRIQKWAKNRAK